MRSAFVFTEAETGTIEGLLDGVGERQPDQWVVDDVLYVEIEQPPNWSDGWQSDQVEALTSEFGHEPPRVVVITLSGRVPGQLETRRLVTSLLKLGKGVTVDDYSPHLWTAPEIAEDLTVDLRRFLEAIQN